MLRKMLRKEEGFTLIELMIVIAIIGILAAIAIPNFISYRNKSYCSAAESDANNIAAALADYFAVPTRTAMPITGSIPDTGIPLAGGKVHKLSGSTTGSLGSDIDNIVITVTDKTQRCPQEYRNANSTIWSNYTVTKNM